MFKTGRFKTRRASLELSRRPPRASLEFSRSDVGPVLNFQEVSRGPSCKIAGSTARLEFSGRGARLESSGRPDATPLLEKSRSAPPSALNFQEGSRGPSSKFTSSMPRLEIQDGARGPS